MTQKYLFQLVNHQDGSRSEPYVATWDEVASTMRDNQKEIDEEDFILLVAIIDPDDEEQMVIPKTPLITIKTFMAMFTTEGNENG